MQSTEYIKNAIRTESVPDALNINQIFFRDILATMIIMGDLGDMLKKKLFYNKPINEASFEEKMCIIHGRFSRVKKMLDGPGINGIIQIPESELPHLRELSAIGEMSNVNIRLLHCALGCYTESGEMLEAIEKQLLTGEMDLVNFGEEVGDIEWYQAIGFDESGVSEESCRVANINKLKKRYPEKFNNEDATNRNLDAERAQLVGGMGQGYHPIAVPSVAEKLYATTDAQIWAQEFMAKVRTIENPDEIDEGLMIAWFANAIETAREAGRKSAIEENDVNSPDQ